MSLILSHNRPAINCDKCCQRFGVTELLVVRWTDLETVSFMCEPCAQALEDSWSVKENNKRFELAMTAQDYFGELLRGRPAMVRPQPPKPNEQILQPTTRRYVLPPPTFSSEDVR